MNNNKKMIIFTDTQLQMIEELKEKTGFKTLSEIIRNGLSAYHKQYFPAYALGKDKDITEEGQIRQAKVKAKTKQALIDEEQTLKLEPKYKICTVLLHGKIDTNDLGDKYCVYTQYTLTGDNRQRVPIKQVDPIMAETQLFIPSKESVFRNRPEVAKKFK